LESERLLAIQRWGGWTRPARLLSSASGAAVTGWLLARETIALIVTQFRFVQVSIPFELYFNAVSRFATSGWIEAIKTLASPHRTFTAIVESVGVGQWSRYPPTANAAPTQSAESTTSCRMHVRLMNAAFKHQPEAVSRGQRADDVGRLFSAKK
jgi:hypothetical protein